MHAQHTAESDSSSMDDIVFVRSVEKRRAPKLGNDHLTKRAKSNNITAPVVSPSPATREEVGNNGAQATASDAYPKLPQSGQEELFLLATRNALEQALGKEVLEAHEKLLSKEKESTEQYIVNLETAVKQQYGTPIVHDVLIQNQMAILKVKAEGQDEAAKTEIKLLRESNTKLTEEKTTLGRCVRSLTDENIVLKRQEESDRAEIQILREHNRKLTENTALVRNVNPLKDEHCTSKAKGQEEASRKEIKMLRENNMKLQAEKTALVRSFQLLKDEHGTLMAEISTLTQDICEQKKLYKKKIHKSDGGIKDAALKGKKSKQKIEQHNRKLIKKNTSLSRKAVDLETGYSAEVLDARERIQNLQDQLAKLEQAFRQRGEQLIELSRDSVSKENIKMQKKAAVEAKGLLQTRMLGMFKNYRDLFKKNKALVDRLISTAEAGGFGHVGSAYRRELKLLKGQPLEELYEFKHQV